MSATPLALVCEDSALIALGYKDALTQAGYRVELACRSEEALRHLDAERPAVAILDLTLQQSFDGDKLAKALTARGVPVIIATGYPRAVVAQLAPGARAVLEKPVSEAALLAAVRAVLGAGK